PDCLDALAAGRPDGRAGRALRPPPYRRHAPARWRPVGPARPARGRPGGRPAPRLAGSRAVARGAALRGAAGPVGVGSPRGAAGPEYEAIWLYGSGGRASQRPFCGAWLLA